MNFPNTYLPSSTISYPCSLRHTGLPEDESDQPNTDLQVTLCQYWAKLNTVLIDVMPWCLVVNETERDMMILEDGERPVKCAKGQTVSPQKFKVTNLTKLNICNIFEYDVLNIHFVSQKGKTGNLVKNELLPLTGSQCQ